MKNILIYFLLLYSVSMKADTLPHWTVYLNNVKLSTFDKFGNNIKFKSSELKIGDKLSVQYFDDTRCSDCTFEIIIRNGYKGELVSEKFKNENDLVELDLTNVLEDDIGSKPKLFLVFFKKFRRGKLINGGLRLFTFTID